MRSSTRDLLLGVALGALALSALGAGGVAVGLRQLSLAREQAVTRAQESAAALVADTQAALRREARLLARDPALVDGVAKGDWATLARGVSPRLAAVTLERVADFISVLDASGSPLLQVPALPLTRIPDPAVISAAPPGLTDLNGHPFVVAAVPVVGPAAGNAGEARPGGFVIIARRLDSVAPPATEASARPGMLFLVNGRPLVSPFQRAPTADWIGATVAGKLSLDGERNFLVRRADQVAVSGQGRLWLLIADENQGRRRVLVGWLTGLGVCGLGCAAAALLLYRDHRAPHRRATESELEPAASDRELDLQNREIAALNAMALGVARPPDIVAIAGEAVDVLRALAQMDAGSVHRLDPADGTLTLIAQRGLTSEFASGASVRPVDGSCVGDAARTGRPIVSTLDPSSLTDPWLNGLQAERTYRTHLALPIPVKGRTWGVIALFSLESRGLLPEEVKVLEAVAHQIGQVVERALLLTQMDEQSRQIETLGRIGRSLTAARSLQDVLDAVADAARGLMADGAARLAIAEGDRLRYCAEAGLLGRLAVEKPGGVNFGEGVTGRVAVSHQPVVVDRIEGSPEAVGLPWLKAEGFVSAAAVPLLVQERLVGVLNVFTRAAHAFTAAEMDLLHALAGQAAIAIEHARLYQDRTRAYENLALAQDQMVRSEKLRALGEMASGVAHDFNNLLAAILGRAQLLLQRETDPKARQWLQIIERSALDGAKTVRRLQEFTRVRRDQPAVAMDLNRVVRETLEMMESAWRLEPVRRGIVIGVVTDLASDLPTTLGDPAELREVVTNLILNAVDAMPSGGTLTLSTTRRGESIELCIADTGVGIPEAVRGKIFDPFFTTKGAKGTGLGLSLTYGILSRHGATITVDSQEGRGTVFTMLFPAAGAPPTVTRDAAAAPTARALRCLVVDDEAEVGDMLADVLRSAGHAVAVARSGPEALERIGSEPLDLVFSDLRMPGMSGWELARAVHETAPGLPVILVSGFAVEVSAEELQASGVHWVLPKPVDVRELLDAAAAITPRGAREGERL